MRVIANQIPRELPSNSRITDLLAMIEAKPPYAVAVNLQFVPKTTPCGIHPARKRSG
jgi:sulfur carrier protein